MRNFLFLLIASTSMFVACKSQGNKGEDLLRSQDFQSALQEKLIQAKDGDVIELPEGTFNLKKTLSIEGLNNITVKGQGRDKTILSFKGQEEGSEGIYASNVKNILFSDFTIQDTKGDNIKVINGDGVTFRNMNGTWTNGAKESNGGYAFYPVQSKNVLIEHSEASFASDAGIYVGQSQNVVVRWCYAHDNVAGIEIENCRNPDVYQNRVSNNTGGILVFDLPGLLVKNGRNCRVTRNEIRENNHANFAPKGNIVAIVPPGTGVIVLATDSVDIYHNTIVDHKTVGVAIASYQITERPIEDSLYGPYTSAININHNKISTTKKIVDLTTNMGKLIFATFKKPMDILYDGISDPKYRNENGILPDSMKICIQSNKGDIRFGTLNAYKAKSTLDLLKYASTDITPFNCEINGITGNKSIIKKINE